MTPLAQLLLRVMRAGCYAATGFMVLAIAIELWKHWRFGGFGAMSAPDISFMAILVIMLAGFLWLARAIGRELRRDTW